MCPCAWLCVQSLIMPWIQKLEILQRRCRGSIASKWSVITAEFSRAVEMFRRGAVLCLYLMPCGFFTQVGLWWPRLLLSADVPDQFKRLSAERGGLSVFPLFFSLPLCCRGNWGKFGLFFVLEGVWNQPACSAFTVPCRPVRGAKVVVAGPFWDADN